MKSVKGLVRQSSGQSTRLYQLTTPLGQEQRNSLGEAKDERTVGEGSRPFADLLYKYF